MILRQFSSSYQYYVQVKEHIPERDLETKDEKEAEASDGMQKPLGVFLESGETVDLELFEETFYVNI